MGWRPTLVLNVAQWHVAKRRGEWGPAGASTWREKEGAKGDPSMAVNSVGWSAAAPGYRARVAPLPRAQGRVVALGEAVTRANVANERDRGKVGPGVNGGVQERAKGRETGWRWGADT
jgi:hypothetical protein